MENNRIQKIKNVIVKKPYSYYFIVIFLAYLGLNIWLNQSFETFDVFNGYRLGFIIPFYILNFVTAFLVAVNLNLIFVKFKDFKQMNKTGGFTAFGIFLGFVGGACPGCFAGVFPALVGIFGASLTLSALPLNGLEIQVAASLILMASIFLLTRENVCKIDLKK